MTSFGRYKELKTKAKAALISNRALEDRLTSAVSEIDYMHEHAL